MRIPLTESVIDDLMMIRDLKTSGSIISTSWKICKIGSMYEFQEVDEGVPDQYDEQLFFCV